MKRLRLFGDVLFGGLLFVPLFFCPIVSAQEVDTPLDDVVERRIVSERTNLARGPVREADIFWEKKIWREIDTREKVNLPFRAPASPLFKHLLDGILSESLKAYHVENDRFTKPLGTDEVRAMLTKREDILVVDVVTGRDSVVRVESMIDWEEVKQFRIKETWYVDSRTGKLEGIITGIAPLREMVNAEGVVVMDKPLFWIYFPAARSYLSKFRVEAQGGNQSTTLSWTDWLDLRYFSGRVTKESNVLDARLKDRYSGREMLMQGEAANRAIFDFEHDLFSY